MPRPANQAYPPATNTATYKTVDTHGTGRLRDTSAGYGAPARRSIGRTAHDDRHLPGHRSRPYGPGMTFLTRFGVAGGLLGAVAVGVPGAIESFTGKATATSLILGVSPFLALPLIIALYLNQLAATGRLATVGYATNLIGLGLFGAAAYTLDVALIHLDHPTLTHLLHGPTRLALLGSALVFAVGSVLFGLSMVRARVYPRGAAWGYTVVLPLFAVSATLPYSPYKGVLHVLVAATLSWLCVALDRTLPTRAQPRRFGVAAGPGSRG